MSSSKEGGRNGGALRTLTAEAQGSWDEDAGYQAGAERSADKRRVGRHSSRDASAATCPAKAETKALSPVIAEISAYSPVDTALRLQVMRAALV